MAKNVLSFEPDFSFSLLAIVSVVRGYKLCWQLERSLNFRFKRSEDLMLRSGQRMELYFQVFEGEDEEREFVLTLLGNKTEGGMLIPEQKAVDYYLKVEGETGKDWIRETVKKLKGLSLVQHVFQVEPSELKSRYNLLL